LIAGNVRTFFASQGNYAGLDSSSDTRKAIIKKAKLVPEEMWNEDKTSLVSIFGDSVTLTSQSSYSFAIHFYSIPQEACIELMTHDWSELKVNHICGIGAPVCATTPIDFDTALSLCGSDLNIVFLGFETKSATDVDTDASML
ncbi:MAG: hypothetical protein IKO06_04460, partial [Alphaproteobacteria bacterium]|nr:hypothetical protein [Alphaproteobacteria bacterium]